MSDFQKGSSCLLKHSESAFWNCVHGQNGRRASSYPSCAHEHLSFLSSLNMARLAYNQAFKVLQAVWAGLLKISLCLTQLYGNQIAPQMQKVQSPMQYPVMWMLPETSTWRVSGLAFLAHLGGLQLASAMRYLLSCSDSLLLCDGNRKHD